MALLMAEATELGEALTRWLRSQRLTVASLARLADVSRRTVYNIQDGASVTTETLRKLARGLATDPYTKAVDRRVEAVAYRELLEAGGFPPPEETGIVVNFEAEVLRRVRNGATASEIAEMLDRWPNLREERKQLVIEAIQAALEEE